jgi:hypothetical protein
MEIGGCEGGIIVKGGMRGGGGDGMRGGEGGVVMNAGCREYFQPAIPNCSVCLDSG